MPKITENLTGNRFHLKAMPGTPMTDAEMERQCALVSEVAEATERFSDDELEAANA